MNRIEKTFRNNKKKVFIAYVVCGDPDISTTIKIMNILVNSGVDLIELGVPFTDPIADGPVIQKSIERALKKNINLNDVFNVCRKFRKKNKITPLVLMGYLNPIENIGYKKFSKTAAQSGVDGVLVVDSPPEESSVLSSVLQENNICNIHLASPTTNKSRLEAIVKASKGYLYYVSLKGITGSKISNIKSVERSIDMIKKINKNDLPVVVGFGIKDKQTAKKISQISDGVIIGSSFVKIIEENLHNKHRMVDNINKYAKKIKTSIVNK